MFVYCSHIRIKKWYFNFHFRSQSFTLHLLLGRACNKCSTVYSELVCTRLWRPFLGDTKKHLLPFGFYCSRFTDLRRKGLVWELSAVLDSISEVYFYFVMNRVPTSDLPGQTGDWHDGRHEAHWFSVNFCYIFFILYAQNQCIKLRLCEWIST